MEEKKEGFSYESPEKQNKNAIKLLIIESAVILVVVVGVLAVLNYLGIFPLSKINPTLFGWLPTKEKIPTGKNFTGVNSNLPVQTPIPEKIDYDPNAKPSIEAVSDIPDYKLTLENKDKLTELLNSWGTFNKDYTPRYGAEGSTKGYPLKKIVIHLVNTAQGTNAFGRGPQDIYSSSITKISPGRFDTYIYIEKNVLEKKDKNLKPNSVFLVTFSFSLYKITHPYNNKTEANKITNDLYKAFKEEPLMKIDYFTIKK